MTTTLPLTYKKGNCFLNAFINKRNHYKSKNLKLVFGSLGLNDWFEYGGSDWSTKEFAAKHTPGTHIFDAHAWLEDTDGNVYDFCFDWYDGVSRTRTKKPLGISGLIEGVSKAELQTKGLTYLPADKATQAYMFIEMLKFLCSAEENLQQGKAYWLDFGHEMSYLAQKA